MSNTPTYPGDTPAGVGAPGDDTRPAVPIQGNPPTSAGAPDDTIQSLVPPQGTTPTSADANQSLIPPQGAGAPDVPATSFPQSSFIFEAPLKLPQAGFLRPTKHSLESESGSSPAASLDPAHRVGWNAFQKPSNDKRPAKCMPLSSFLLNWGGINNTHSSAHGAPETKKARRSTHRISTLNDKSPTTTILYRSR